MPNSLYPHKYTMPTIAKLDPNSVILPTKTKEATGLYELMINDVQPWQVHNCKVVKLECNEEQKLPFLYHYEQLPVMIKDQYPLTGMLLKHFNKKTTAQQACELIGINTDTIKNPKFVKITGSIVVFLEQLQLAVRFHWSNTSKEFDEIYCETKNEAIKIAAKKWLFIGQVDTLYKQQHPDIALYDEQAAKHDESEYILPSGNSYKPLPNIFSINLVEQLNNNQQQLQWVSEAIKARVG